MRQLALLFALLFITVNLYAQDTPPEENPENEEAITNAEFVNVGLVQPEVWQLARPPGSGIDAYGDLSMTIPIMTVPGRGMDFDIAFSYRAGIAALQPASWIGLGWSFDPGSISREPEGAIPGGMYGVDLFDIEDSDAGKGSAQPDHYFASLPHQGSLEFTQSNRSDFSPGTIPAWGDGSFVPYEHRAWNIEAVLTQGDYVEAGSCANLDNCINRTGYQVHNQGFTNQKDFDQFTITTEDGTRYIFRSPTLGHFKTLGGLNDEETGQIYVNTWRLEAILSADYEGANEVPNIEASSPPDGKWIVFKYGEVVMRDANDGTTGTMFDGFTQTQFLEHIITPTHYAAFNKSPTLGPIFESNDYRYNDDGAGDLYYQLDDIELRRGWFGSNSESDPINQKVVLEHKRNQTNKSDYASPYFDIALGGSCSPGSSLFEGCQGRLLLWELHYYGLGGTQEQDGHFSFTYGGDPEIKFDHEDSKALSGEKICIDDFGYFNIVKASTLAGCGADDITGADNGDYYGGEAWSLTRVDFPTGGFEEYDYETDILGDFTVNYDRVLYHDDAGLTDEIWHLTYDSNLFVTDYENQGGVRVKSVKRGDGMGNTILTTYEYGTGKPTGVPSSQFDEEVAGYGIPKDIFATSNRGKIAVIYDSVTQFNADESYVTTEYVTPNQHGGLPVNTVAILNGDGNASSLTLLQDNTHWLLGKTRKVTSFAPNNTVVHRVEHALDIPAGIHMSDIIWGMGGENAEDPPNTIFIEPMYADFIHHHINSTTVTNFEGSSQIATTTTYTHDPSTNLTTKTVQSSQDHELTTEIRHAFKEYSEMETRNMLIQEYSKAALEESSLKQKQWTKWSEDPSGVWRPNEVWQWAGSGNPEDPSSSDDDKVFTYVNYDSHGMVISTLDAAGTTTNYTWGHEGALPTSISAVAINGGTLETTATYDDETFWMKSLTGPDNVSSHFEYDVFGRLKNIKENAGDATPVAEYTYGLKGSSISASNPNFIETRLNSSDDQLSRIYFDGLGRPIQTQLDADGSVIVTATDYDEQGRELAVWAAYSKSGFSFDSNHGTVGGSGGTAQDYHNMNNPYVRNYYENDPRNRIEEMEYEGVFSSHPATFDYGIGKIGVEDYAYTTAIDENGHATKTYTDTYGNTRRIESPENAITEFTYDVLGQLTEVVNKAVQNNDQSTSYSYDTRGRLITKSTPDTEGDFEYRYDIRGNLRFVQDPNQRTNGGRYLYNKYDDHNRITEQGVYNPGTAFSSADPDNSGFPSTNKTVKSSYDYAGALLEKVTFYDENDISGYYEYGYDGRGRISSIIIKLPNLTDTKIIEYDYDLQGRVTKISYENGQEDHFYHWYSYDRAGRLELVEFSDEFNNQSLAFGAATYEYWPNGQVSKLKLGDSSSPVQTVDYSYNIRGWLESINNPNDLTDSGSIGGDAFGLELAYEANAEPWLNNESFIANYNGNISSAMWTTNVVGQSAGSQIGYVFEYDEADRLTKAENHQNDSGWDNGSFFDVPAITYDKVGNILSLHRKDENGSGTDRVYGYQSGSNRLTSVTGRSDFSYDDNGNIIEGELTEGVISELVYDYRNLPVSITSGSSTYEYSYDANGQRIYSSADNAFYIRGAGGEVVAVYSCATDNCTPALSYWNLLAGSEVIGRKAK